MRDFSRRGVIGLAGGAAAWPVAVGAQQPALPVIGLLSSASSGAPTSAIQRGLKEAGLVEGENVTIDYRSADGHYDRLPGLASDLVRRQVTLIVTSGSPAARAAKAATAGIPIVFGMGEDPVKLGVVTSLNRPSENITGVSFFSTLLEAKRLEILHETLPQASAVGLLINPTNANVAETEASDVLQAARKLGMTIHILTASIDGELTSAFASFVQKQVDALIVGSDPFFNSRRDQLISLAAHNALPTIYQFREFVGLGGLMSYGTSITEAYRQTGIYAAHILKGTKPADLPVILTTRFELAINLKTAKALRLEVPPTVLARADEVIE